LSLLTLIKPIIFTLKKIFFQIIEALPATDDAASFIETLGNFYEIVDPTSENAKELKKYARFTKY